MSSATPPPKKPTGKPPTVTPEAGWQPISLPFNIGSGRTVYSDMAGDNRLRLAFFGKKDRLVGRAWFGDGTDGPPNNAHGGAIAYVLDEVMGAVGWLNQYPVVAVNLNFSYAKMTPLYVDMSVEGWITKTTEKRVFTASEMRLPTGEVVVTGQGEFAILKKELVESLYSERFGPEDLEKLKNFRWAKGHAR
ncbi:MAG: PaaI family thioesterase [Bdellovibrionota bacterium]